MSNTPSDAEIIELMRDGYNCRYNDEQDHIDFARAVLAKWGTQPQAGAVPQGWKAVPVNPTPEMWKAAKTVPDPNPPYPPHYGLVWDAMLAASPTPPAEQQAAPKAAPASNESAYQRGYMDGMAKGRRDAEAAPKQEAQEPAAFINWPINGPPRLVWYSQKALNDAILKTHEDGYKPDVKLYTAPQPAPATLREMPYEKRKAIQEGEQIGASDAWFHARHEMLDTLDRRNVFRAGFDRGWNAALAAQGVKA